VANTDKQKQSLYFPDDMLREIMREATRLDRSLSWTVQQAWRVARQELRKFPSPSVEPRGVVESPRPASSDERRADADPRKPSAEVLAFLKGKFERELTS
jgi:uncharacterized small protein (TIGR04563 family)